MIIEGVCGSARRSIDHLLDQVVPSRGRANEAELARLRSMTSVYTTGHVVYSDEMQTAIKSAVDDTDALIGCEADPDHLVCEACGETLHVTR